MTESITSIRPLSTPRGPRLDGERRDVTEDVIDELRRALGDSSGTTEPRNSLKAADKQASNVGDLSKSVRSGAQRMGWLFKVPDDRDSRAGSYAG